MNTDCIVDRLGMILETIEDAASWIDNDPDVSAWTRRLPICAT
jgi:hypothetical protein